MDGRTPVSPGNASAITPTLPALEASGRSQTDSSQNRCVFSTLRAASLKMKAQAGFLFNSKFIVMRAENSCPVIKCSEGWRLSRAGKCCCQGAGGSQEREQGPFCPGHYVGTSLVKQALLGRLVKWVTRELLSHWLLFSCSVTSDSLRPHGLQPARLLCPWNLPARILEWLPLPPPGESSRPRDGTRLSCTVATPRLIARALCSSAAQMIAELRLGGCFWELWLGVT